LWKILPPFSPKFILGKGGGDKHAITHGKSLAKQGLKRISYLTRMISIAVSPICNKDLGYYHPYFSLIFS
jgi:hypothetical protein